MIVIETDCLTRSYGRRRAVDGVSLAIDEGQIFGFIGPNGCGKTTTMAMLLGVTKPSSGSMRLLGESTAAGLQQARRHFGAILEQPAYHAHLNARDNLRISANIKGVGAAEIDRVLALVRLDSGRLDRVENYSLGMKQRLAVAAALLGRPRVLMLDEPTNGLDPDGIRELRAVVRGLASDGTTVVLSSHHLAEVERTCTHVAMIVQGKVIAQGSMAEHVGGIVQVRVSAYDMVSLLAALEAHPSAAPIARDGGELVMNLDQTAAAALGQFLADRGVVVSGLARRSRTLEDAFMAARHRAAGRRA